MDEDESRVVLLEEPVNGILHGRPVLKLTTDRSDPDLSYQQIGDDLCYHGVVVEKIIFRLDDDRIDTNIPSKPKTEHVEGGIKRCLNLSILKFQYGRAPAPILQSIHCLPKLWKVEFYAVRLCRGFEEFLKTTSASHVLLTRGTWMESCPEFELSSSITSLTITDPPPLRHRKAVNITHSLLAAASKSDTLQKLCYEPPKRFGGLGDPPAPIRRDEEQALVPLLLNNLRCLKLYNTRFDVVPHPPLQYEHPATNFWLVTGWSRTLVELVLDDAFFNYGRLDGPVFWAFIVYLKNPSISLRCLTMTDIPYYRSIKRNFGALLKAIGKGPLAWLVFKFLPHKLAKPLSAELPKLGLEVLQVSLTNGLYHEEGREYSDLFCDSITKCRTVGVFSDPSRKNRAIDAKLYHGLEVTQFNAYQYDYRYDPMPSIFSQTQHMMISDQAEANREAAAKAALDRPHENESALLAAVQNGESLKRRRSW